MKLLDPISGETVNTDDWDRTNLAIMPASTIRGFEKRMLSRGLPRPVGLIDLEFDEELFRYVPVIFAGDPGDER